VYIIGGRKGGEGEKMTTALICRDYRNVMVLTLHDPTTIWSWEYLYFDIMFVNLYVYSALSFIW